MSSTIIEELQNDFDIHHSLGERGFQNQVISLWHNHLDIGSFLCDRYQYHLTMHDAR